MRQGFRRRPSAASRTAGRTSAPRGRSVISPCTATALVVVFKLVKGAQKSWRRLDGHNQLPKLILDVKFSDGLEVVQKKAAAQLATATA